MIERRRGRIALLVTLVTLVTLGTSGMALPPAPPPALPPASDRLDAWIVTRFRGAQLFPDAEFTATSLALTGPRPRIEGTMAGVRSDTVVAVHFSGRWAAPALGTTARVPLADPTGSIMPLTARIIGRRAFRAPRTPGPSTLRPDSNWRYGWAYLAVIPHDAQRPVTRLRGWLLLDPTTSSSTP
jgi:hypothetical protein